MKKTLYAVLLAVFAHMATAQVLFTAEASRYKVAAGESFTVTFKINTESGDFKYPDFNGFRIVSGPMTGFSTTIINGRMSQEKTASFDLLALKPGTFTIGPASVKAGNEVYKTKPLTIDVSNEKQKPGSGSLEEKAAELAAVKILTNKRSVYVGEPIAARYALVLKTNIGSFDYVEEPDFQGFLKNDIELTRIETQQEVIDGERVTLADIRKFVLIPQTAGTLRPGTLRMRIPTQVPTGRTDWWGRQEVTTVNQISTSAFPAITVKPLPEAGKPATFSGAVGNYKLYVSLSRNTVKADESITLTVEVAGSGNIQVVELPKPVIPGDIESYEPKYKENISIKTSGVSGFKRHEYLLLPRFKGNYKIPALTFAYFDVDKGQYVTLQSQELEINVTEGPQAGANGANTAAPEADKSTVKAVGQDILFIHTTPSAFALHRSSLFISVWHKVLLLAAFAVLLAMYAFARWRQNYRPDMQKQAQRQAGGKAAKVLKEASALAAKGDINAFYAALSHALQGYFADKFAVPASDFTSERVAEIIVKRGGAAALAESVQQLLKQADMARFAPLIAANMHSDVEKATSAINQLEKL